MTKPWEETWVVGVEDGTVEDRSAPSSHRTIADVYGGRSKMEDREHLIAAAPDMYKALLIARATLKALAPAAATDHIDFALQKARGER